MAEQDRGLTTEIGALKIDWPRTLGYYGGIGVAVAVGMIDPPFGLFIAVIPFVKMLNQPSAPLPARVIAQFFDGMAKPVGGDSEATIQLDMHRTQPATDHMPQTQPPEKVPEQAQPAPAL